ncbi:hypothetical protein [Ureibacillus aquaedulcis]|uniref:DUF927 domain-containing protein n=1 Tax=Ureibacillus aquaedulcis TaxID=3058421 RepID=A0ABT8GNU4_9BACL|nr:hypothetical protein [Ureibacillus sp. BA0131]MDN4493087.1 hypothetical protein [Ureibacillus sp. BA0131]
MNNMESNLNDLPFNVWEEGEKKEILNLEGFEYNAFTEKDDNQQGNVLSIENLNVRKKMKKASVSEEVKALANELEIKLNKDKNKKSIGSDPDAFDENEFIKSKSPIKYEENFIYITEYIGDIKMKTRLSNFIINPLYTINSEDENTLYYVRIQNSRTSKSLTVDGETLSNNRLFKSFCRSKGNFNWLGTQKNLDLLNDYLISSFDCPEVQESNYMGFQIDLESYNPEDPEKIEDNVWLFPTHAFYNGELLYPDSDGIIHTPKKNYLLNRKNFSAFNMSVAPVQMTPNKEEVLTVLSNLYELYSNYLWLGIGYMTASLQVSTIAKYSNQFPYFYPAGVRHTGKTDYLNFMYKFAGINAELNVPPERLDVFRKHLAYYSHLPYGYDEAQDENNYKATSFFERFKAELKTLFNRKEIQRGDKDPNKIHRFPIRTVLTFSGEVPTSESAIRSRTVFVESSKFYHDMETYDEVIQNEEIIHWMGQYMMRTSHGWRGEIVNYYHDYLDMMKAELFKPILSRVKKNYAIILAGATVFMNQMDRKFNTKFNTPYTIKSLLDFVYNEMVRSQEAVEESQNCVTFLSQVAHLANTGMLRKNIHYKVDEDENSNPQTLYLAHSAAWNALQDSRLPTTYNATNQITSELEQFSFFVKSEKKHFQKKIGGKNYRVWVFNLQDSQIPEFFQHFSDPQYLIDKNNGPY